MSGGVACSLGCFICGNVGDGPATGSNAHDPSCCKSTRCNSQAWDQQCKKWLKAEKKHKTDVTRWLLAETLYKEQCESWLRAQAEFRVAIRVRAVKRVRVQAAPATPQTAKVRAHAR